MTSKNDIRILLILILFLIQCLFSQKAFSQRPALENISPSLLNQWVSEIFKRPKDHGRRSLPVDHYGKCATPLIRMALAHPEWLEPENRFILHRPDDPSFRRYYYADQEEVPWIYDTPEGHFKIHYSESGVNAVFDSDGIKSTIPDYVSTLGSYFEQVWVHEIDILGYTPPPPDGTEGGDSRFDVYILNMDYYGYTEVENGSAYIAVHNNYRGYEPNMDSEGSRVGNMKITAAHEFFHAIQYGYDDWNDDCIWWEENTAVWMEDEVFDDVNGYLNYLGNPFDDLNDNLRWDDGEPWYLYNENGRTLGGTSGRDPEVWFEAPHLSLDTLNNSTFYRYEYGGVLWAKYLSARFGPEFIKDSFIITDYKTDALTALIETFQLQDYGTTLEDAFSDFRVKVLTLDAEIFEEGSMYPLIRHYANYEDYPIMADVGDISHLACRYIGLKAPVGEKKLVIEVEAQDNFNLCTAIVLFKDTGYETRYIPINNYPEQTGRIEVISFGTQGLYKRAAMIPMNLSTDQDYRTISISVHLEGLFPYDLYLKEGINLVSLPLNLAGVMTSYDLLEIYFYPADKIQFAHYDLDTSHWQVSYLFNYKPNGSLFDIDWLRGYVLTLTKDMIIHLAGDIPVESNLDLLPGHNLISTFIADISGLQTLSAHKVIESADPNRQICTSIRKYDTDTGKWQTRYWFFSRLGSQDFEIQQGEGYMIDMLKAHPGWSPP